MRHVLPLLAILLWAACQQPQPQSQPPSDADTTIQPLIRPGTTSAAVRLPDTGLRSERPAERAGTLSVEGTPEPVTLQLYDEPSAPFTTYLPEGDFIAETPASGQGTNVRFVANFGGVRNDDAYLHFFFPDEGAGLGTVDALRAALTGEMGAANGWTFTAPAAGAPRRCAWASQELTSPDGYACLATHGTTPFFLVARRPAEYADGFGPRAALILDELRWRDTGAGLTQP